MELKDTTKFRCIESSRSANGLDRRLLLRLSASAASPPLSRIALDIAVLPEPYLFADCPDSKAAPDGARWARTATRRQRRGSAANVLTILPEGPDVIELSHG